MDEQIRPGPEPVRAAVTGRRASRRTLLTTTAFIACLLSLALAPASALALGRPAPRAPEGTVMTAKPAFTWSKVAGAKRYEVRVVRGSKVLIKKTGLTGRRWTCPLQLPRDVKLTWAVRARSAGKAGAWSARTTFRVAASARALTSFSFERFSPAAVGVVREAYRSVSVTVPYGTAVEALVPTFSTTGVSVAVNGAPQTSGVSANDFTDPVVYRVTAENGATRDYQVTVRVAPNPAKAITAFSFEGLDPVVTGIVNEQRHIISAIVPYGTQVTSLVASFATSGERVEVGGVAQVSGLSPNDFTGSVTYKVTAEDGTAQDYVVTVYALGKSFQGGLIAAFFAPGDTGYVEGEVHGLVVAASDQSTGIGWSTVVDQMSGASGTGMGDGKANTDLITTQPGCTGGAAYLCQNLELNGYADWYLPSITELDTLYQHRSTIGGLPQVLYWSSTEYDATHAWYELMGSNGGWAAIAYTKERSLFVRAVRAF
jgi:hypothetical protein